MASKTLGWSLFSSGVVTLILKVLPYDSMWWGLLLLILGLAALYAGNQGVYER